MEKIRVQEPDATIHIIDCFTLWLTRERRKGEKSKFKKYFDTLPEEFSVPLTMSEEEFQLLPRQLKRRAERERIRLEKRFDYLKFITQFHFEGRVSHINCAEFHVVGKIAFSKIEKLESFMLQIPIVGHNESSL